MRIRLKKRNWRLLSVLLLCLSLIFASCGDSSDSENTKGNAMKVNSEVLIDYTKSFLFGSSVVSWDLGSYIPRVDRIQVSSGTGNCDVTIYGELNAGGYTIDVQVMGLYSEIILLPIAKQWRSGTCMVTPFKGTVHIVKKKTLYNLCYYTERR